MKRRNLLVALLLAVLACVAWKVLSGPQEPVYQGHTVSYWLEHYCQDLGSNIDGPVPEPRAVEAIRHIGTKAIPTLLRMVRAHDAPLKLQLMTALAQKQHLIHISFTSWCLPGGAVVLSRAEKRHRFEIRFTPAWEANFQASQAFKELGSAASNVVPGLIEICDANISPPSRAAAAEALGCIGPAAKLAVPALLRTLADTNYAPRSASVRALGSIHAEPQLVVPALMKALSDPGLSVIEPAWALGDYGPDATVAAPLLTNLLHDTNADVRWAATYALKRINAPAAAQAGRP